MQWISKLLPKDGTTNIDGMIIDQYNNTLLRVDKTKTGECHVPQGIQFIHEKAFVNCISLSNIYLPDSVLQIQDYAFKGCTGLMSINVPSKVHYLHKGMLENCIKLQELYVQCLTPPVCLNYMTNNLVSDSDMLLYMNHFRTKFQEGDSCFAGVNKSQCVLYIPKGTYELYSQSETWRQFKIIRQN